MKNFSLKFIDIMIGVILGLGFQNWGLFNSTWQYIAFIFIYMDIIDYWIDYSPSLKKFPPKREINLFLDISIMFLLFLLIYSIQFSVTYLLTAFVIFRILDYFWLFVAKREYIPTGSDKLYVETWMKCDLVEICSTAILLICSLLNPISSLAVIICFVILRLMVRIYASFHYKKIHFA